MAKDKKEKAPKVDRFSATTAETIDEIMAVIRRKANIDVLKYEFISDSKLKSAIKVKKISPMENAQHGKDIKIIVNEGMYLLMGDDDKLISIEEEVDRISVVLESGKITVKDYDFKTTLGMISMHDINTLARVKKIEIETYEQMTELESGFTA